MNKVKDINQANGKKEVKIIGQLTITKLEDGRTGLDLNGLTKEQAIVVLEGMKHILLTEMYKPSQPTQRIIQPVPGVNIPNIKGNA